MLTQNLGKTPSKFSFSTKRLERLAPPLKGQSIFWDAKTPGLGLRITKNGVKSFILQSRLTGKTVRLTIGQFGAWNIQEAQVEARRLAVSIDRGIDPRIENKQTIAVKEQSALSIWLEYIKQKEARWSHRYYLDHVDMSRNGGELITRGLRRNQSNIKEAGFLRPLLDFPLNQITRDLVITWIEKERNSRPLKTRLALAMLKAFIRWAANHSEYKTLIVDRTLCERLNQELPAPKARRDCLQKEQLKVWFQSIKNIQNQTISAYLQTLLLTGARREEWASLKWSDIDTIWHTAIIRDKVQGTRIISLTPYVEHLLSSLPKINDYVFASHRSQCGYLKEPRIALDQSLSRAQLPFLTIHGLRRSFGTLAEWVECPAGISAQIMGHKPSAIAEKHYRQRPVDLLRKWHIRIEQFILQEAEINF
ncbi:MULTISPECIES: integrase family protein [unclassified Polynucleobacter]|uniref:tyrosine-type recombinase/integrase n=1 Tax=unclassified Polynucleobacter TaxID=2640945 RepID=UPI000AA6BC49|nr:MULTISPECIES: integrase family protein [unclassified Polynucleobacter]